MCIKISITQQYANIQCQFWYMSGCTTHVHGIYWYLRGPTLKPGSSVTLVEMNDGVTTPERLSSSSSSSYAGLPNGPAIVPSRWLNAGRGGGWSPTYVGSISGNFGRRVWSMTFDSLRYAMHLWITQPDRMTRGTINNKTTPSMEAVNLSWSSNVDANVVVTVTVVGGTVGVVVVTNASTWKLTLKYNSNNKYLEKPSVPQSNKHYAINIWSDYYSKLVYLFLVTFWKLKR